MTDIGARLLAWRLPPIETWPRVVAFARSWRGRLVLFALFAALMKLHARDLPMGTGSLWLVTVYFYPAYVRCFRSHPRLRLAFATFMAAGVGNFFFHFIMTQHQIVVLYGFGEALVRMQSYAFYCVLLSAGIVLSQLRARRPDAGADWLRRRLLPFLAVSGFFCFLSFFEGPYRSAPLAQLFRFLFHMLGIDRFLSMV